MPPTSIQRHYWHPLQQLDMHPEMEGLGLNETVQSPRSMMQAMLSGLLVSTDLLQLLPPKKLRNCSKTF